jgi:hypothetical protein
LLASEGPHADGKVSGVGDQYGVGRVGRSPTNCSTRAIAQAILAVAPVEV